MLHIITVEIIRVVTIVSNILVRVIRTEMAVIVLTYEEYDRKQIPLMRCVRINMVARCLSQRVSKSTVIVKNSFGAAMRV